MQAKGHEEISKELADFLYKLIKKTHGDDTELNKTNFRSSLYMGNWLSDFSQMLAPDMFHDKSEEVRKPVYISLKAYNGVVSSAFDWVQTSQGLIHKLIKNSIENTKNDYAQTADAINQLIDQFNEISPNDIPELVNPSDKEIEDIVSVILGEIDHAFKQWEKAIDQGEKGLLISDTNLKFWEPQKMDYAKKGLLWELALVIIKLLAFKKFRLYGSDELVVDESTFHKILKDTIPSGAGGTNDDEDKVSTPLLTDKLFYLDRYYPIDHLDRPFDHGKLSGKKAFTKPEGLNRKVDYWHDDAKNGMYTYLEDSIDVIAGHLQVINRDIFEKVKSKNLGADFYSTAARLGQALHGVEDFFAHSNYIELLADSLDSFKHPTLDRELFQSKEEFVKDGVAGQPGASEHFRAALLTRVIGRDKKYVSKQETNLVTGVFGEKDIYASLAHILLESLNEKNKDGKFADTIIEASKDYFLYGNIKKPFYHIDPDTQDLKSIWYFFELFKRIDEQGVDYFKDEKNKIDDLNREFTSVDFKNIFGGLIKPKDGEPNPELVDFIVEIINVVRKFVIRAKLLKEFTDDSQKFAELVRVFKLIFSVVSVIMMLVFFPEFLAFTFGATLMSIRKKLLKFSFLYLTEAAIDKILKELIVYLLNLLLIYVNKAFEHCIVGTHDVNNYGSHTILAKDEALAKGDFYPLATQKALLMDKMIVHAMITKTRIDAGEAEEEESEENTANTGELLVPDFKSMLRDYLRHPVLNGVYEETVPAFSKDNRGTYQVVLTIPELLKNNSETHIAYFFRNGYQNSKGADGKIADYYMYVLEFLKANPHVGFGDLNMASSRKISAIKPYFTEGYPNVLVIPLQGSLDNWYGYTEVRARANFLPAKKAKDDLFHWGFYFFIQRPADLSERIDQAWTQLKNKFYSLFEEGTEPDIDKQYKLLLDYLRTQLYDKKQFYTDDKFEIELSLFENTDIYKCGEYTKSKAQIDIDKAVELDKRYKEEFIAFMNDFVNK